MSVETMTPLDACLEMLDARISAAAEDALPLWKCRGLIRGYDARWKNQSYVVSGVEQIVTSDLWNPATERKSRSFILAGKLDSTGYIDRRVVIDHKTTSEEIADPNSTYWRQLAIEGQVSHYMLLEWLNGRKVDEAVWDVMRKPSISPKALAKADAARVIADQAYCGIRLSDKTMAEFSTTGRENGEMYGARLAQDCTETRPDWYFARRTVPRTDADLLEYATDLWEHAQEMLTARRLNRWPRNPGACLQYGRPCRFLGICSGSDTPESDGWRRKAFVHNELTGLDGDGRDVLTTSRVRCFQTCRRKHYYEYELGIERVEEDEAEALKFGTLWHEVLECWWKSKQTGENQ